MWTREELKMRGKQAIKKNYWSAVLVALVIMLVSGGASTGRSNNANNNVPDQNYSYTDDWGNDYSYDYDVESILSSTFGVVFTAVMGIVAVLFILFTIFIGNPLLVGGNRFFILNQTEQPSAKTLGYAFTSGNVGNVIVTMFLMDLYIALWSLLLVIPGIIKAYEYRMIPYILAENPGMERSEAFMISKQMMDGQKWNTFVLDLSFLGWELLSAITFGIVGVFYVNPYREATFAELYTWNREAAFHNGFIQ